jgi:cutinase
VIVVNFGDPFKGSSVGRIPAEKVLTICHKGDNICDGGILVLPPHLNYDQDAGTAAAFVLGQAGL